MNSEIAMREEELQMPLKVAREIVTKYEKDFNNGIIAYEGLKKILTLHEKYWIIITEKFSGGWINEYFLSR